MAEINIETVVGLLRQSIGIEAAEKFINEAIEEVGFARKSSYSEAEFKKICDTLKKKGGYVKMVATVASRSAYRDIYYQEILAQERKDKEDLARWNELLEQRVQERTAQLRSTQGQLVQAEKMVAVGQLGAGVGHELNNPMGAILGYTQFILEKLNKPGFGLEDFQKCKRYVEIIGHEAERCKAIVENLLRFSRVSKAGFEPDTDINKVLKDTLALMGYQVRVQKIEIIQDLSADSPKVVGNPSQLQQIFTNLILNAQQAMLEGGRLKIITRRVAGAKAQTIEIKFADTGKGISQENLNKVFNPFFTTKRPGEALGLGLTLCYQMIQAHKGEIKVESELGRGTTFTITIPAG